MFSKLSAFVLLSLVAPVIYAQGQRANISSETTAAFVAQFENVDKTDQQEWQTATAGETGHDDQVPGMVQRWIQASNKKEPCKVYASARLGPGESAWWDKPGNHIDWDGGCLNGHAFGIGREFLEVNGELSSWLGEYDVEGKPKYFLITDYDRQTVAFKAAAFPWYATLGYAIKASPAGDQIAMNFLVLNMAENRLYRQDTSFANDQVSSAQVLPNKNSYSVVRQSNPSQSAIMYGTANGKGERIGYGVLLQNNGITRQTRHLYQQSPTQSVDVILPQSYLVHLTDTAAKISANLSSGERVLQEAYVAINKYKRRICKGDVRVDFVDSEIYGRICLENGELSVFSRLMAKLQENQKLRHEQARADLARNQEAAARQRAAQSEQQRNNAAAMAQSINEFASGMEALQQRASDFTRSFMNANPSPGVQFGQPDSLRTNCMQVANAVHCRTQ